MFVDEQTDIPYPVLFSIHVPSELPRTAFLTRAQQLGVRTNFVQEEPLDLQCLTTIWAIYVVDDVSTYLDILTFGIQSQFGSILHLYLSVC